MRLIGPDTSQGPGQTVNVTAANFREQRHQCCKRVRPTTALRPTLQCSIGACYWQGNIPIGLIIMDDASTTPDASKPAPIIIKKYANRRLYNTGSSSYITLEHLAALTREGRDFQVLDAKSGEDITRSVLTQIVMDGENGGQTMLPISFLRQLISMYGNSMQSMVPHYLEASMNAFAKNQAQFRDVVTGAMGGASVFPTTALKPFEAIAKQNLAMFQAASDLMSGRAAKAAEPAADDLGALKDQMNALQAKLDKLSEK